MWWATSTAALVDCGYFSQIHQGPAAQARRASPQFGGESRAEEACPRES
jgi:hypothetical protein